MEDYANENDENSVEYQRNWQSPFVLDARAFRDLCRRLSKYSKLTSIIAKCEDGMSRKFLTIENFINFDNKKHRRIVGLRLEFSRADSPIEGSITLGNISTESYKPGYVELKLAGAESDVENIRSFIEDEIKNVRPWFWILCRLDYGGLVFFPTFFVLSVMVLLYFYYIVAQITNVNNLNDSFHFSVTVISLFLTLFVLWCLKFLQKFLFPSESFCIGDGILRKKNIDNWRRWMFCMLLVSLAGSGLKWGLFT